MEIGITRVVPRPREWPWVVAIALGYGTLAHLAVKFFSADGLVSFVYPTPGISIALLLVGGLRWWPAVFAGEVLGNLLGGLSASTVLGLSTVDTIEPMVAAAFAASRPGFDRRLTRLQDFVTLMASALLASVPAACVGAALLADSSAPGSAQPYLDSVVAWWRGEFAGMLVLTPLILVWREPPEGWRDSARAREALACFVLAFGVGAVLYMGVGRQWLTGADVDYLPFLFVAWAGVRLGRHGVLAMVLMFALQALGGALQGQGVYADDLQHNRLLYFWMFIVVLALTGILLALAMRAREDALAQLHSGEARLRFLLRTSPVVVYTARPEGDYAATWISDGVERITGWTAAEFLGEADFWMRHVHPDDLPAITAGLTGLFAHDRHEHEYRFRCKDGSWRWMRDELSLVRDGNGRPVELVGSWIDITPRRQAEERIRAALSEKEVLLKEVYHRVKNNLQVVSSLLNLQSRRAADGVANALLQQSANRVSSMAFVHEQLYRSGDLSSIAFGDYAVQLVTHLRDTQGEVSRRVPVRLDIADVRLGIETAIPLGLVVNELVSNAWKHAFRDGRVGQITVALQRLADGRLELAVSDDGIGLPPGFSLETPESLGMQLVVSLAAQLGAALSQGTAQPHGTVFRLRFAPDERDVPAVAASTAAAAPNNRENA